MSISLRNGERVVEFRGVELRVDVMKFLFILGICAGAGWLVKHIGWETHIQEIVESGN